MDDGASAPLADELPPPLRLAVAYAPARARAAWIALLVLDRRLARAALGASEPLLGQVRLAWWRERFRTPAGEWPEGEPLLAALAVFDRERDALEALVDGWERLVGGDPDAAAIAELGEARVEAVLALARVVGCATRLDAVAATARSWAQADLARMLGNEVGRDLVPGAECPRALLPHVMRPLAILVELSRSDHPTRGLALLQLLRIVRLGMFGR